MKKVDGLMVRLQGVKKLNVQTTRHHMCQSKTLKIQLVKKQITKVSAASTVKTVFTLIPGEILLAARRKPMKTLDGLMVIKRDVKLLLANCRNSFEILYMKHTVLQIVPTRHSSTMKYAI